MSIDPWIDSVLIKTPILLRWNSRLLTTGCYLMRGRIPWMPTKSAMPYIC